MYGTLPNYQRILAHGGVTSPADAALVGDEDAVTKQVEALFAAGATDLWAAPFPVGEDRSGSRRRTRASSPPRSQLITWRADLPSRGREIGEVLRTGRRVALRFANVGAPARERRNELVEIASKGVDRGLHCRSVATSMRSRSPNPPR